MDNSKNVNVFSLLESAAKEEPDSIFFTYEGNKISYKEGLQNTQKCAAHIASRGVKPGDRVVLCLQNTPEFVYSYLAIAQIGAISVLVGPVARRYEVQYIVAHSQASLIITSQAYLDNFTIDNTFFIDIDKFWLIDENHPDRNLTGILQKEAPLTSSEPIDDERAVSIIYTSAMDGFPLGVQLTHKGIIASTKVLAGFLNEDDHCISVLPLFHAFGLTVTLIMPIQGRTPFTLVRKFNPQDLIPIINNNDITLMAGVPRMFLMVNAMVPAGKIFKKLRVCISGGEGVSGDALKLISEKYELDIREGYGLTEASPIVTWNHMHTENRYGSVGKAMEWNEIKIVDDKGKDVKEGETGEVMVKGINVTSGYYNAPEKTKESFDNGWLHTGDLGHMDSEGYLYLTGLKKKMILNSGFNVYPLEVERILKNHPAVDDVSIIVKEEQQPGDIVRQYIEAEIKSSKGVAENELKIWCKDNISNYKIPRSFNIK
ncbi:MAG: AMP-binding protein [Spirochaetes bacterium]|jgi:long-chain acyl-CoA synthetase|nr:AMP-binding protein [Spirochaetota bacterium]